MPTTYPTKSKGTQNSQLKAGPLPITQSHGAHFPEMGQQIPIKGWLSIQTGRYGSGQHNKPDGLYPKHAQHGAMTAITGYILPPGCTGRLYKWNFFTKKK
jgi:hypothetical protein